MVTIYGIKNCTSMKKAFDWCAAHGVDYVFHDFKKAGVPPERLLQWCQTAGWQSLLNKRGTTWRKLTAAQQAVDSQDEALALMQAYPSVIKRPVVETGSRVLVGFDPQSFAACLERA
ncbi:Protein YffB [Sterolibacterium denitrificans]|uniref:Protein YffB n=2 Tax=Sterolibacterium denitrificans TaxID=157592 RepID=A0A7Z7MWI4_9PROT|nr:arsenate reductase [Sterolibacterium denitrificans]KYC29322.1 ArsC family transcriptional regulator [Sterolibacterium denitrificans]SMB30753.1 Protein YffB [Sterolibacterium denitrificans]